MYVTPRFEEVSRALELLSMLLLWIGIGALASWSLTVIGGRMLTNARARRSRKQPRAARRAVQSFADAVAKGDLVRAERELDRVLTPHALRRTNARDWIRVRRRSRDVLDERIVLRCRVDEVFARLRGPDDVASHFPGTRRVQRDGGTDLVVEPYRLRLRVLREQWQPDTGLRFEADAGGPILIGHMTIRPLIACSHAELGPPAVEVTVHVETASGRLPRSVRRGTRSVIRAGLRHLETELRTT